MSLSPGIHLDVYEVTAKIGEAGMRVVYTAQDPRTHRGRA